MTPVAVSVAVARTAPLASPEASASRIARAAAAAGDAARTEGRGGAPDWGEIAHHLGAADGRIYTSDIARLAEMANEDASRRLRRAGVPTAPPPGFSTDGAGRLVVDHPEAQRIEAILAADPALSETVRDALTLGADAARWDAASMYQEAYARAAQAGGPAAAAAVAEAFDRFAAPRPAFVFGSAGLELTLDGAPVHEHMAAVARALGLAGV